MKNANTLLEAGISLAACLSLHHPWTFQGPLSNPLTYLSIPAPNPLIKSSSHSPRPHNFHPKSTSSPPYKFIRHMWGQGLIKEQGKASSSFFRNRKALVKKPVRRSSPRILWPHKLMYLGGCLFVGMIWSDSSFICPAGKEPNAEPSGEFFPVERSLH